VVRGDLQQNVHKRDVSAITGAFKTFRLLMALAAAFDLEIMQIDAVNAFINADIDEDVYVPMPQGYMDIEGKQGKVLKLRKAPLRTSKVPQALVQPFLRHPTQTRPYTCTRRAMPLCTPNRAYHGVLLR